MTTATGTHISHEIGSSGLLAIRLHSSAVRLRAVDGTEVRIHDSTGTIEGSARVERSSGSLSIRASRWFTFEVGGHGAGARMPDIDVDVPRAATVVIESASGRLMADGLIGDQRYRSASGSIAVTGGRGEISVDSVSGDVRLAAVGPAAIVLKTVSGDAVVSGDHLTAVRVATTSGDIRIDGRLTGEGPFTVESVSGDTILAPLGGLRVDVRTVAGDVRSDVPSTSDGGRGSRSIVVGGGGPAVRVRSISGDVRIVATSHAVGSALAEPVEPDPSSAPDGSLDILRALERGEIDVAEATRRIDGLQGDGTPASVRGTGS